MAPAPVREILDAVERVLGRPVPVVLAPRRPGDPPVLYATGERARRELGWTPRLTDIDIIVATAAHRFLNHRPADLRPVRAQARA